MSRRQHVVRRAIAGTLAVLLGCDASSATRANDDLISVRASSSELVYRNLSEWPIWVFSIERDAIAYTDWIYCTDASKCEGIPSGGVRREPLSRVIGYAPGK